MIALTDTAAVSLLVPIITALLAGLGWLLKRAIYGAADAVVTRNSAEHEINKAVLEDIRTTMSQNHADSLAAISAVGDRVTQLEEAWTAPKPRRLKENVA